MSPLLDDAIDRYVDDHTTPLEPLLEELHTVTWESVGSPEMISGPVVGQLLRAVTAMAAPSLVLEIGTFTGYSALAMAGGLPAGGRIVTCELSAQRAEFAQSWFDRSPHGSSIEVRVGPALDTIASLDGPFDLVFIDADKEGYREYYEAVMPKLSPRGVILADNTLRGGDVVDPHSSMARAAAAFNDHVHADPRTENVLLTIRDGLMLVRRGAEGGHVATGGGPPGGLS
jgi:caffeoyl-CoA O-methyltransferase